MITLPKLTPAGSIQVMTSFLTHVHTSSTIGKESPVNDVYDDVLRHRQGNPIPTIHDVIILRHNHELQ